ncbi:MAG: hypothetical protein K6357_03710 [Elusimicrobiota bacterium]
MKKLILTAITYFFVFQYTNSQEINISSETSVSEEKRWEVLPKQVSISGIVLTPTAYRSNGINEIGPSIDFNAAYYIGRLYGKNSLDWTIDKKNYLDRIGIWYFETDGKLLIERETKYLPSLATGFKGIFTFRDSPQPSLNRPGASFKVDSDNTNTYSSLYFVISKQFANKFILNAGYSDGDFSRFIYQTSEFLSDKAIELTLNHHPYISKSTLFFGMMYIAKNKNILGIEAIVPQGSSMSPKLINLQLGTLLKLNFQISYLKYNGGYEYLGTFNFRYSFFPRITKQKQ